LVARRHKNDDIKTFARYTLKGYGNNMLFVEAKPFTRRLPDYLTDDEYREFQNYLTTTPDSGDVVQNTGGIRKVRWKLKGSGKRGGLRAIYFWHVRDSHIYLLFIYRKNEFEDLEKDEYAALKSIVERWK